MGIYDTYGQVQLKVGVVEFRDFKIGDEVNIEDGVYVAREGAVVIVGGKFVAEFPHLFSKWGDVIYGEDVIRPHDYIQDAVAQAEHQVYLQNRIGQAVIPTRDKAISLIDLCCKRDDFVVDKGRTPEEYFEEYSYKEPEIWIDVLNDLLIPVPQGWVEFIESHS